MKPSNGSNRIWILVFSSLILVLAGCGLPSLQKAERTFLRSHPGVILAGSSEQITNTFYAEFRFYYSRTNENETHVEVWTYRHGAEAWLRDGK